MLLCGNDYNLDRSNVGRKNKSVVVAVGHDDSADKTGGNAPGSFKRGVKLVVAAGELNVKSFCKAVAEEMGSSGLKSFTVVHHSFDGIGCFCACEFFFFGFLAFDHRDSEVLFANVSIDVEHLFGLCDSFLCGFVHGVAFLPKEFHGTEERTGGLFPTNNAAPLVIKFRKVAVRFDYVCVMVAEKSFGSGAYAHSFLKLFAAAHGDPCNFRSKAFDMVFFFLKKAFGNEHRHINVFVAGCFKTCVEKFLDVFPDCVTIRAKDHASANAGIIDKFSFFYNVGVPLGKIVLHGGDCLNHFFLVCHFLKYNSLLV